IPDRSPDGVELDWPVIRERVDDTRYPTVPGVTSNSRRCLGCSPMRSFLLSLMLAVAGGAPSAIAAAQRPNILFIMSDDHAAHAVGAYGSVINQTPHLDRLAREGLLLS